MTGWYSGERQQGERPLVVRELQSDAAHDLPSTCPVCAQIQCEGHVTGGRRMAAAEGAHAYLGPRKASFTTAPKHA